MLWFAFKKYLWFIDYNSISRMEVLNAVVICFQKVSLIYWLQLMRPTSAWWLCCDLLSKSIFDLLITTPFLFLLILVLLWFAFKKYLWFIDYNFLKIKDCTFIVVICFQKVSLIYWLQRAFRFHKFQWGCDLLSKSIFDLLITTCQLNQI